MSYPLQYIDIIAFQNDLLEWYGQNKRVLPWRDTGDPYKIWVSEIMLQQTQVKTVIPYFNHFMRQFPTVFELAEAKEQTVLKAWEGLGYYSRARNLQAAARDVVFRFNGIIPNNSKDLGSLKGIGPYTRGAILSIAFNKTEPAVDGNVMRVMSRLLQMNDDIAMPAVKKKFEKVAGTLIPTNDPSSFNQALMELGALVCVPKKPLCSSCPIQSHCQAYQTDQVERFPVKSKPKSKQTESYAVVLITSFSDWIVIEQRKAEGLLANLWQFPMVPIEKYDDGHIKKWLHQKYGLQVENLQHVENLKHTFTHKIWKLSVYTGSVKDDSSFDSKLEFVRYCDLDQYPFPVSHQKMMPNLVKGSTEK